MENLSRLFFKDYYNGITFRYALGDDDTPTEEEQKVINSHNETILKMRYPDTNSPEWNLLQDGNPGNLPLKKMEGKKEKVSFKLEICYPGLVTGIGLVHDSKKLESAFNLGMHFNYTYGMPIVYGSSIKGILRYYFKEFYKGNKVDELYNDIFEGKSSDGYKSIYQRDLFFDAVVMSGDSQKRIVTSDSITPHKDGPLKDPLPITFLKIASGSVLQFNFRLVESKIDNFTYSIQKKKELFEDILRTVGVGAKTNVGYGQLK